MKIATKKVWIVIADGGRYRLLQSTGKQKPLLLIDQAERKDLHNIDQKFSSDKQGRGRTIGSGQHYSLENKVDFHEQAEERFLISLAEKIERQTEKFDQLVIVAPPKAMGILRSSFGKATLGKIKVEVKKDITSLTDTQQQAYIEEKIDI